eukprot:1076495-Prorocentrum_minimum.AAC.1
MGEFSLWVFERTWGLILWGFPCGRGALRGGCWEGLRTARPPRKTKKSALILWGVVDLAGRLLGESLDGAPSKRGAGVGSVCLYFAAPKPTTTDPILFLN